MALVEQLTFTQSSWFRIDRLRRQIKDYCSNIPSLIWQRQAVFFGAMVLTGFYFDITIALACYSFVLLTEAADLGLARKVEAWNDQSPRAANRFLVAILVNTALSASGISFWVYLVAQQQGVGGHFMPLIFLFAAALFAAMNNHQFMPALGLRLTIYGVSFLIIPLSDLWKTKPPLSSDLWLNFFSVVFVMYFVIDSSLVYLRLYRKNLRQLEELTLEHERTKVAYQAKSQFLSTVSHELRTPLTSIKGSLDLVNSTALGPIPEKIAPVLTIAGKNSQRLADLIDDLLDLQKIEAGEIAFHFDVVDICNLVREAVEATQGYADPKGITIKTILPEGDVFVEGDESRLMQVLANLLSNAAKFSPDSGDVTVRVETNASLVRLIVEDNGVGIPEGAKEQVFGQFSQVDGSDQRKVGGTGLGMSITKRIVDRHNGIIDYQSALGQGTKFFVELDRVRPENG